MHIKVHTTTFIAKLAQDKAIKVTANCFHHNSPPVNIINLPNQKRFYIIRLRFITYRVYWSALKNKIEIIELNRKPLFIMAK